MTAAASNQVRGFIYINHVARPRLPSPNLRDLTAFSLVTFHVLVDSLPIRPLCLEKKSALKKKKDALHVSINLY